MKLTPRQFINVSLLAFFFLALFLDNADIYRSFFFVGVIPGVLWFFRRHGFPVSFTTTPAIFLQLFIAYLSVNSFFVSDADWITKFDQLRWGIEVLFLFAAVILSSRCWFDSPRFYGRLFLSAVFLSGLYALIIYVVQSDYDVRLSGGGFLSHPIQGPSTLLVLWTIGCGLILVPRRLPANSSDHLLLFFSGVILFFIAILSQSRGPVATALVVFAFSLTTQYILIPAIRRWIVLVIVIAITLGLYFFLRYDWLINVLTARELSYRPEIWSAVINGLGDYWLIGVGSATKFIETVPGIIANRNTGHIFDHTHNIFLQVLLSGGVIALFMLLGAMISVIHKLFVKEFRLQRRSVFAGSAAVMVFVMVNLTDTAQPISAPKPDWVLFWLPLLFATSLVSYQFEKKGIGDDGVESTVRKNW